MSMYMTDTFCSFTKNVIFKSCFLFLLSRRVGQYSRWHVRGLALCTCLCKVMQSIVSHLDQSRTQARSILIWCKWTWDWFRRHTLSIAVSERGPQNEEGTVLSFSLLTIYTSKLWSAAIYRFVSWEPEGRYHYSTIFCWEAEGRYCCTKSIAITVGSQQNVVDISFRPFWIWANVLWLGLYNGIFKRIFRSTCLFFV